MMNRMMTWDAGVSRWRMILVLLGALVWASIAAGQEQWLTYHAGSTAQPSWLAMTMRELEVQPAPPAGLALPTGMAGEPIFAVWKTPLAPAGQLWLAVGRSKADGPYDRLVIDANANGRLDDEQPATARELRTFKDLQSCTFPGLKLVLPSTDGPVTYHLDVAFWKAAKTPRLQARSACWYQADVTVGGRNVPCLLLDANVNGAFNDGSDDPLRSDIIKLGDDPIGRVGRYVQVDGAFYALKVAQDGSGIAFSPAADLALGQVRAEGVDSFSAGGANGLFHCQVRDGLCQLPVGRYHVQFWQIRRKDGSGATWEATGTPKTPTAFEVAADGQAVVDAGEPLSSTASVQAAGGGAYQVSDPRLLGRHGERVTLARNGQQPDPPKLRVSSQDGSYTQQLSFAYG
jgi:hypothetical protein